MCYTVGMIEKVCEVCAATFQVKPYRAQKARFCGFACGGKWHMANRQMPNDHKAGNQWRRGKRPTNAFTAEQVRELNTVRGRDYTCTQCGTVFELTPWLERQNKSKSGRRFCSKPCHGAYKAEHESGERAASYVGGITTYRGKGWPEARGAAIRRDGGACQHCGVFIGGSIPVHHKRPYRLFASAAEANVPSNLICLCQPCHMREERRLEAA